MTDRTSAMRHSIFLHVSSAKEFIASEYVALGFDRLYRRANLQIVRRGSAFLFIGVFAAIREFAGLWLG
jgi:hypothetical protein